MQTLYIYLAGISLLAILLTWRDKASAKRREQRVPERTLLLVSALGGSVAMLTTMLLIRHKTKHRKFTLGIPALIVLQIASVALALDQSLSVNHYTVNTNKITAPVRLALVTDLHSCDYGNGQDRLIKAVLSEQPDVILLGGDIFDDDLPPEKGIEFVSGIARKAPIYYVSGNHEFWSRRADKFKDILISYGVKVLEGTAEDIEIRGERLRIYGIDDPDTGYYPSRALPYAEQLRRLRKDASTDRYRILLAHRPERVAEYLPIGFDMALFGHAHGGQWRIPWGLESGLFSPGQGLFPKYSNGMHISGQTTMIVSRGMAKESTDVPRVFNRPELVMITLIGR